MSSLWAMTGLWPSPASSRAPPPHPAPEILQCSPAAAACHCSSSPRPPASLAACLRPDCRSCCRKALRQAPCLLWRSATPPSTCPTRGCRQGTCVLRIIHSLSSLLWLGIALLFRRMHAEKLQRAACSRGRRQDGIKTQHGHSRCVCLTARAAGSAGHLQPGCCTKHWPIAGQSWAHLREP